MPQQWSGYYNVWYVNVVPISWFSTWETGDGEKVRREERVKKLVKMKEENKYNWLILIISSFNKWKEWIRIRTVSHLCRKIHFKVCQWGERKTIVAEISSLEWLRKSIVEGKRWRGGTFRTDNCNLSFKDKVILF